MKTKRLDLPKKPRFTQPPGSRANLNIRVGQNLPALTSKPANIGTHRSRIGYGPAVLGLQKKTTQVSGPGLPGAGFLRGSTSMSEWYLFWAFTKLLGPVGVDWDYQSAEAGGRHILGGAVVDFILYQPHQRIGVRLVTYRFHLNAGPSQKLHDYEQLLALSGPDFIIIDVFEQDFIEDETGQAAIQIALDIINRNERPHPLGTGFVVGTG